MPRHDLDQTSRLLRDRVRALFRQVPKGLAGDEEAIHQMRVAGRRLRVALPLLARRPGGRRVLRALRELRELTRIAGTSRDLDVITGLLRERLSSTATRSPEAGQLARRLAEARRRSRHKMAESLMDLEIARLRRDLRRALARGGEQLFPVLVRLREVRDGEGTELLDAFSRLQDRFDPVLLHALRRRARRLRYSADLSDTLRQQETEAPALFRELQERLGAIHDAHVLSGWLGERAARAERLGQRALGLEARRHERFFLEEALRHHRELLERRPAELVERALAALGRGRSVA